MRAFVKCLWVVGALAVGACSDDTGGGGGTTDEDGAVGTDGGTSDVKITPDSLPPKDGTPGSGTEGLVGKDGAGPDAEPDGIEGPTCGEFGDSCESNGDCCSGFCVEGFDGANQCTVNCVEDCPENFVCLLTATFPDAQSICVPKVSKLCRPCTNDLQCSGGACVEIGNGEYCSVACAVTPCPNGYECKELESGAAGCLPSNGSCDCSPASAGIARACAIKNDFGVCNGLETCAPATGWGQCDARVPSLEECNGIDDDCDGTADEDFKDPKPCESLSEGIGACVGVATCQGTKGWVCSADTPFPEACDFLDNDCDGETDEEFKNSEGRYTDLHHCGGCNKDCEGIFPNATSMCDGSKPTPQCLVETCAPGHYKANDYQCLPKYETYCQPCVVDFQCGGGLCVLVGTSGYCAQKCGAGAEACTSGTSCVAAKDPLGAPHGQACVPTSGDCSCTPATQGTKRPCTASNAEGICYGFETCDAISGWSTCSAVPPSDEVCNGIDDDCDGINDDGLVSSKPCDNSTPGIGTCSGEAICQGQAGWVCGAQKPIPELCDFKDNDCDGEIDETFKNGQEKYNSNQHCGSCNTSCQGTVPNATAECNASFTQPVCVVMECEEGFYKLNDFICLPEGETECRACSADIQCDGQQCMTVDDGNFCAALCSTNAECKPGFECKDMDDPDTGGTAKVCIPLNGTCDCRDLTQGAKRACEVTNGVGTCVGFSLCDAPVGWGTCGAKAAVAELCDGLDNDCNGLIDDGIATTQSCTVENTFGTCSGTATCVGAQGYVCNAKTPAADICNYLDDDCDGATDEAFKDAAGKYSKFDDCGSCGHACGDDIDNSLTETCDASKSKPLCIADECEPGFFRQNDFQCIIQPNVGCLPCKVNADCFGGTCLTLTDGSYCAENCEINDDCDDGFLCDLAAGASSGSCVPTSGSCDCTVATDNVKRLCTQSNDIGTCVGFSTCDAGKGWSACDAGTADIEACNGLDDDCNGIVDDDLPITQPCEKTNAIGTCKGDSICQGGQGYVCKALDPALESCDFQDNDCDGIADDGFVDASGRYITQQNCGTCGKACGNTVSNASAEKCDATKAVPQCVATGCDPGYFLLNEFQCIPNPAIQCSPCVSDDTCFGGKCTVVGSGKFCLESCATSTECDSDYACSQGVCKPNTGSCDCSIANDGKKRTCEIKNALGSCLGFETCDPDIGWNGCTATTAEIERCDGLDNDCNGLIDDGLPETQTCFKKNVYGECQGAARCYGVAGWVCQADEPGPEICDFKNNDCDVDSAGKPLVDEDFRDANGRYTTSSHCGTCNVACGNQYEHTASESCDASKSVPQCIVEICDPQYIKLSDYQCIEVPDVLCEPCSTDANCFGEQCMTVDAGKFCLTSCGAGKPPCAGGYNCISGKCRPANGTCDCRAESAGNKRTCKETNSLGVCYGFETCEIASGWDDCDALPPVAESCNGVDDDCNGFLDDGLPGSIPCESTGNQYGKCSGTATCFGTVGWFCTAPIASAEVCDYKDNDCDGLLDEGFINAQGKYGSDQNCGECGNNCADEILNGSAKCDATRPVPQCIVNTCDNGWEKHNDFLCIPIVATLCEACATDDNCIGAGARCVPLNDGPRCGTACDDDSDCSTGYHCYDVGIGAKQCVPLSGSCDCDGTNTNLQQGCTVTYTAPTGGPTSTCFGTNYCTVSGWSGCQAPAEQCNGVDDDCDGLEDESFKDAAGKFTSVQHCGKCNRNCAQLTFPNAVGVCMAALDPPNCSFQCLATYFDVNKNPADGCECKKTSSVDYVDGVDQNCDGMDGDEALGIFVSKTGVDTNPGTRALPKRTIKAGVTTAATAAAGTKRDVYVATGVYGESITLAKGISVYGGYNGDYTWRDISIYETAIIGAQPDSAKLGAINAVGITGAGEKTTFNGFTVFGSDNLQAGKSSYTIYVRNSESRLVIKNNRLIAGSGGDGASGAKGVDGSTGPAGADGAKALNVSSCNLNQKLSDGGTGGKNTCKGTDVDGGRGGEGYCPDFGGANHPNEAGVAGSNGGATAGTSGFDPYIGSGNLGCIGGGCGLCYVSGSISTDGLVGADGPTGAHGAAGAACSTTAGSVVNGEWVAGTGIAGDAGQSGGGGGGGGAGGGVEVCLCSTQNGGPDAGGTGGGGGAGGCGSDPGNAGTGGGGSFGIFLVWDTVPASLPDVAQNAVQRANGGRGGVGGNAGVGGVGGIGGYGGMEGFTADNTWCSGWGGAGGKGGAGGHAGGGGGGCGGSSYGLYASGQGTVSLAAIKSGNTLLPGGAGGTGGQGGLSLKNSGSKGADGAFSLANF